MNVLETAQNIAGDYAALGDWIGVATGPPGNSSVVNNEATGGTNPPYARQQVDWTYGTNGSAQGSAVILNLPPGTYPYMVMCKESSGDNMVDWCVLPTPIEITGDTNDTAPITITPSITFR